ncbi:hypothetical protein J1N35_015331 [Gossypium stocksii]|uniref:Uncharacterized protein n=1 Tax=Gossypium stocksii TaxID=47602 RepID=A0A9D3VVZ3_9ROSI|nr:hypothetical protein J1N35_015331 [Gossypium stocksii]
MNRLMMALSGHTEPIQLFTELTDVEPNKDFTPLSEKNRVQDLCTEVSRESIDRRSSIRGFKIDLNTPPASENLNPSPRLQIHLELIETDADGEDGYDNHGPFDHKGVVICNDLGGHISIVDPNVAYASEFPEYLNVLLAHQLVTDLELILQYSRLDIAISLVILKWGSPWELCIAIPIAGISIPLEKDLILFNLALLRVSQLPSFDIAISPF